MPKAAAPGGRVLLDAHNCYPYDGKWADRIDRALATGLPVAIEQDLVWWTDPATKTPRSIVSHGEPFSGKEPSMKEHFFERVRPIVEQALREQKTDTVAADRPQPRSQDERTGASRGAVGAARRIRGVADDGDQEGRWLDAAAARRQADPRADRK